MAEETEKRPDDQPDDEYKWHTGKKRSSAMPGTDSPWTRTSP